MMENKTFRIAEAAAYVKEKYNTFYQHVHYQRKIPFTWEEGKRIFTQESLDNYLESKKPKSLQTA